MTTDFMKDLLEETKLKPEEKTEEQLTLGFQLGFVIGTTIVAAGVIALEAVFFCLLLLAFGFPFSFWQGLAIAATVQLLSYKFKSNG